jgi:glycosyltransferase involved in cell wall biosynthesis
MQNTPVAGNTSKIKVLHVVTRMNTGGVAVLISELVVGMDSEKFEVGLICGSCSSDEENYVESRGLHLNEVIIPTLQRSLSPINDLKAFVALAKEFRKQRPDIVHTHTSKAGLLGRIAAKLVIPNARVIHTFHGHLLHGYFSMTATQLIKLSERMLAKITHVLISMGNEVKDNLLAASIGRPQQYQVAFPGIREIKASAKNLKVQQFSELHKQDLVFTFVGRLSPIKRCDRIIQIAKELHGDFPQLHFLIIGDGELRESLEVAARNLPITFLGWESNTQDWLAISDCAILFSDNEAVPLAMIEAGFAGLPVLATNVGSMGDVVCNGINGYLVEPMIEEIKSGVVSLVQSVELRESFGEKGRELAREKFSIDAMVHRHGEIYSQVIRMNS